MSDPYQPHKETEIWRGNVRGQAAIRLTPNPENPAQPHLEIIGIDEWGEPYTDNRIELPPQHRKALSYALWNQKDDEETA